MCMYAATPQLYCASTLAFIEHVLECLVGKEDYSFLDGFFGSNHIAIDPKDPSQLLICVGTSQQASRTGPLPVTPFLQRFDLGSFQSISKQPLTRTNTTELVTNPNGYPIVEPRACQLAFSYDGRWLATIDEWEPPERDISDKEYEGVAGFEER